MSSFAPRSPFGIALYALAIGLFAFEATMVWVMLHPKVSDDFRAYYIDKSTTCLNQPVAGTYDYGTIVSFLPDKAEPYKPLRVCGWEGPGGDGTHAVGTSSRLRFVGTAPTAASQLNVEMSAVSKDDVVQPQTVDVLVDGEEIGQFEVTATTPAPFSLPIPPALLSDGRAEVTFEFPDAVRMGRTDPDTRWRSVKMQSAGIVPVS